MPEPKELPKPEPIVIGEGGQEYKNVKVPDEHLGERDKLVVPDLPLKQPYEGD